MKRSDTEKPVKEKQEVFNKEEKTLALFDFDGTISREDSLMLFLEYMVGKKRMQSGFVRLSHILILYRIGLVGGSYAKERIFKYFFSGMPAKYFNDRAEKFAHSTLSRNVKRSALDRINWHLRKQHKVVVVSASIENYLKPWAKSMGLDLISTKLEVRDEKVTGNYKGKNCKGKEKSKRIKEELELGHFEKIYAYGDTKDDEPMLNLADEKFYRSFN